MEGELVKEQLDIDSLRKYYLELENQMNISDLVASIKRAWKGLFPSLGHLSFIDMSMVQDDKLQIAHQALHSVLKKVPINKLESKQVYQIRSHDDLLYSVFFLSYEQECRGALIWLNDHEASEPYLELVLAWVHHFFASHWSRSQAQDLLNRDELTGLYNQRYLDVCLEREIRRVQRYEGSFGVLFIDLDSFKSVNDTYGHLAGTQVLRQISQLLKDELRDVDSIFRYGGDEFVVILLESNPQEVQCVAERLREKIAQHSFRTGDQVEIRVTVSIGMTCCPQHGLDREQLLHSADQNMYQGKRNGRNIVVCHNDI